MKRTSNWQHPRFKRHILETLAKIAFNNKIDPDIFFNTLVNAWRWERATCGDLIIECRVITEGSAVFLFSKDQKIIAQFPVSEHILLGENPIKSYTDNLSIKSPSTESSSRDYMKIKDLKHSMRKVKLKARILEIPEPKSVFTRFGTYAYVSNALIADETGVIRLSLWNQQINAISVDDVIEIEKAKVVRFENVLQLRMGRSGRICVIEDPSFPSPEELKKSMKDDSLI